MAFAFDCPEVARPTVESPALKSHFKVDEERPAAFTVRTGQHLQKYGTRLSGPEISLREGMVHERAARAAKRIRALLDVECAAERVGEEVDGRDNCEWGGSTRTVSLAAPACGGACCRTRRAFRRTIRPCCSRPWKQ